jgi:DNA-binding response OmpR family regulator
MVSCALTVLGFIEGNEFVIPFGSKPDHQANHIIPMSLQVMKEQIFIKMQELDTVLQTAVNVRTELWSAIASLSGSETSAEIGIPLTFYENGHIIAWGDDSEHFSPATFELLRQMWFVPNRFLSKEDIRQDVIGDDESTDNAIWVRMKTARQELDSVGFPYEIETLRGKGYRLTAKQEPNQKTTG